MEISTEEQALIDRVGEHDTINREQAIRAAELMLDECQRLDEGEFTLLSIGHMFIDCASMSDTTLMTLTADSPSRSEAAGGDSNFDGI